MSNHIMYSELLQWAFLFSFFWGGMPTKRQVLRGVFVFTWLGGLRVEALRPTKKVFSSHRIDVVRGKVKMATFSTPGGRKKT